MTYCENNHTTVLHGAEQFTIKPDFYQQALVEFKNNHPWMQRESDFTKVDREAILKRAAELRDGSR